MAGLSFCNRWSVKLRSSSSLLVVRGKLRLMSDDTGLAAKLSIVVPLYNEEQNIEPLLQHVHEVLAQYAHDWELILVDDGSSDNTLSRARELAAHYGTHVRVVGLQRNFGQTAAMQAGIDFARGELVATMDGDLQNDPRDIPRLLAKLEE